MSPHTAPTELQLDALREVANVGVGQAATALSRLLGGRRVELTVPRAVVLPVSDVPSLLGGAHVPLVAVTLAMRGELSGHLMLALAVPDARRLVGALLEGAGDGPLGATERSALAEVANILASAFLTAVSRLTGLRLLPSPPTVDEDAAHAVVGRALLRDVPGGGAALVLEARFLLPGAQGVEGQLLLITESASMDALLARLGV